MVLITHTMRSKPTARSRVWPRRRSERRPSGRSSVRRRHRHPDRVTDHRLSLAALECEGGQVLITRLQRLLLVTGGVLEVHQEQAGQNKTAPAIPAATRAVLGFVLPARAADSYPVRTWFQDKHWTVVQMHSLTSQAQFCQLTGTRGIASFSLSQNDKGDDPQAESPRTRGALDGRRRASTDRPQRALGRGTSGLPGARFAGYPASSGRGWPAVSGGASERPHPSIAPSHSGVTKLISCRIQSSIQQVDRLPRRNPPPPLTALAAPGWHSNYSPHVRPLRQLPAR